MDSLSQLKPHKSECRYYNSHYQNRFYANDTITYYYHGKSGKCLTQINAENKFECEDYRVATDTVISYKEYPAKEKILGQQCKVIEWQGKYFNNRFYVSTEVKIPPATYREHMAYNWKFYGDKAHGGLILKSEHTFKNYTMAGIAATIQKEKGIKIPSIYMDRADCFSK